MTRTEWGRPIKYSPPNLVLYISRNAAKTPEACSTRVFLLASHLDSSLFLSARVALILTMSFARTFLHTSRALCARSGANPLQQALRGQAQAQFYNAARGYATIFERTK